MGIKSVVCTLNLFENDLLQSAYNAVKSYLLKYKNILMKENRQELLKFLLDKGLLRAPQIEEIENILKSGTNKGLREILIKGGFADAEKLAVAEAEFFNFPYVNLLQQKIDDSALGLLPLNLAEQHAAISFSVDGRKIKIALARPEDYNAKEAIDFWASSKDYSVEYFLCSEYSWSESIKRYGAFGREVASALSQVAEERKEDQKTDLKSENLEEVIKSAPVAQIVSMIVKQGITAHASDIHIEPFEKASRIRFRIDGILNTVLNLPTYVHDSIISRIKVLSNLKIDETRVPQDGRFKYDENGREFDLRVSIMPLSGKEKATMRILDVSSKSLTLSQLGFSAKVQEIIEQALKQTYGMILVTGPTGSGKSTTLFSILSKMNKEGSNITTLEDPIEYNIVGINQAQVRPEVNFTFASGLRALMRQDPDIIMVGEIRDNETAEMAVHAALTGHLLFSTLHTNDAVGSIPRLIDMKAEPFLLASTLNLIIAQRLSRRICFKCRESYELTPEIEAKVRSELAKVPAEQLPKDVDLSKKLMVFRGRGCPVCKNTGYTGRVVIAEILPITDKMRSVIADGFNKAEVEKELKRIGVISLLQDGIIKSLQGTTSLEEVFRVSKEIEEQT